MDSSIAGNRCSVLFHFKSSSVPKMERREVSHYWPHMITHQTLTLDQFGPVWTSWKRRAWAFWSPATSRASSCGPAISMCFNILNSPTSENAFFFLMISNFVIIENARVAFCHTRSPGRNHTLRLIGCVRPLIALPWYWEIIMKGKYMNPKSTIHVVF